MSDENIGIINQQMLDVYLDFEVSGKILKRDMADTADRSMVSLKKYFEAWEAGSSTDEKKIKKCLRLLSEKYENLNEFANLADHYFVENGYSVMDH